MRANSELQRETFMSITESEALAIAEEAARRVLAARPTPSCVSLTDAAEMLECSRPTARKRLREAGAKPNALGKYPIEDVWRVRGPISGPTSRARG
jgi:hypothetical protein